MYTYALTLRIKNQAQEKVLALLRGEFFPAIKPLPGLISLAVFPQADGEQITLLSEWKSQQDAENALGPQRQLIFLWRLDPYLLPEPHPVPTDWN